MKLIEFIQLVRMYSRHHSLTYSMRVAYGIAFRGLPF